jgi:hypothetical protein
LKDVSKKSDTKLASSSDTGSEVELKSVTDLYNDIGMNLCKKPLTSDFWKSSILKKFPGNPQESIFFYIFFSDKLTEEQKKDFLTSVFFSGDRSVKLEGEYVINSNKEDASSYRFFSGKDKITITEFQNNLYNFILTLVDSTKISENLKPLGFSDSDIKVKMDNIENIKKFINENSMCN